MKSSDELEVLRNKLVHDTERRYSYFLKYSWLTKIFSFLGSFLMAMAIVLIPRKMSVFGLGMALYFFPLWLFGLRVNSHLWIIFHFLISIGILLTIFGSQFTHNRARKNCKSPARTHGLAILLCINHLQAIDIYHIWVYYICSNFVGFLTTHMNGQIQ